MSRIKLTLMLLLTFVVAFIGGVKTTFTYGEVRHTPFLVKVDPQGQATLQEVYGMLVDECRNVPWKHEPPARPTCEDMAMLYVSELLLHGEVKTR